MTGSTYLDFDKTLAKGMRLIRSNENRSFGLLTVVGINLGLRISDLLQLTFNDLRGEDLIIKEGKTGKERKLKLNPHIKTAIQFFEEEPGNFHAFRSQKRTIYSIQQVNRLIKKYFKGSRLSSHTLRKTFGRQVWNNNQQSEKALLYLSELFNHTSVAITRKYLGIRQEELDDIYMNL
ncbi:tyrosine-type recombinase/integrase [Christiangramia sp. ASW11-125]|uniref:tyrosine-type recombinase/integrase n=1 Tax=Christiangramia sp. ASW11-125 TaxID=3400701 RepID=UPI003AB00AF8